MNPFSTIAMGCGSASHNRRPGDLHRRNWFRAAGLLGGASWLTLVAEHLARADDSKSLASAAPPAAAKALIVVWLEGGPSQLETFDPHPGTDISEGTTAIDTRAPGIQLAHTLPLLAEQMHHVSIVRSLVSKEGDHERATYNTKTGYRPDPTLIHPSLGAVLCHQTEDNLEIPRHISILPGQWPARGGYLGEQFDAFKTFDPVGPIPDIQRSVSDDRFKRRLAGLNPVEEEFARGRLQKLNESRTLHQTSVEAARKMMSSDQLSAFNVSTAPQSVRAEFGDTPFGRSCLAAVQLIEVGVRCVEVNLGGWDTHANNLDFCQKNCKILDPAIAALISQLSQRGMLDKTLILIGGEFGRTPKINPVGGRDHWPHGFSMALAGGGIKGGKVVGETSPTPKLDEKNRMQDIADPRNIEDIHATIMGQLGINFKKEMQTPIGRPMALSQGKVIQELLS